MQTLCASWDASGGSLRWWSRIEGIMTGIIPEIPNENVGVSWGHHDVSIRFKDLYGIVVTFRVGLL